MSADLKTWDDAIRTWRAIRRSRPLGISFAYPDVSLPPELMSAGRYPMQGYSAGLLTLDRVAAGYA